MDVSTPVGAPSIARPGLLTTLATVDASWLDSHKKNTHTRSETGCKNNSVRRSSSSSSSFRFKDHQFHKPFPSSTRFSSSRSHSPGCRPTETTSRVVAPLPVMTSSPRRTGRTAGRAWTPGARAAEMTYYFRRRRRRRPEASSAILRHFHFRSHFHFRFSTGSGGGRSRARVLRRRALNCLERAGGPELRRRPTATTSRVHQSSDFVSSNDAVCISTHNERSMKSLTKGHIAGQRHCPFPLWEYVIPLAHHNPHTPKNGMNSIGSSVLCGRSCVQQTDRWTDGQTDRYTQRSQNIGNNRPHRSLHSMHAMRPNDIHTHTFLQYCSTSLPASESNNGHCGLASRYSCSLTSP